MPNIYLGLCSLQRPVMYLISFGVGFTIPPAETCRTQTSCVCVCVSERNREGERETEIQLYSRVENIILYLDEGDC